MTRSELLAGLRRMGLIFSVVLAVTVLASIALGLLAGSSVRRSVSVGLYVVAVICIVLGLFQGIKPPVRPLRSAAEEEPPSPVGGMLGTRGGGPIRWATGEERGESIRDRRVPAGDGCCTDRAGHDHRRTARTRLTWTMPLISTVSNESDGSTTTPVWRRRWPASKRSRTRPALPMLPGGRGCPGGGKLHPGRDV